jgi:hypothetical protein
MTGILDQVARSAIPANHSCFQPTSPEEFFALQLACKLHEPSAAQHYSDLLGHYSVEHLLTAFHRATARGSHSDPARSFHDELRRLGDREVKVIQDRRLAAIRIERRGIAVVILSGYHLEYPPLVRQLPSDINKAQNSAAGFISSVIQRCPFATAALETLPGAAEVQRQALLRIVQGIFAEQAVGIWQVEKRDILAAYGYPPLSFRGQVQKTIEGIWPDINGSFGAPLIKDALALGLYCQTEYLFNL